MNSELWDATVAILQQAAEPMKVSQIKAGVSKRMKAGRKKASGKAFNQEFSSAIDALLKAPHVHEWPKKGTSQIFCSRSFRSWIEGALLNALNDEPLTIPDAAKAITKLSKNVSKTAVLTECKPILSQLAESNQILQLAPTRQVVMYFSFTYLERLIPRRQSETSIADLTVKAIERLQTRPGNYVSVRDLRNAPELLNLLDEAALALASKDQIVLGHYDGPRATSDENKSDYIADHKGDLFIGVALPRTKEASA